MTETFRPYQLAKPFTPIDLQGAGGGKSGADDDPNTLRSNASGQVLYLLGEGRIEGVVDGLKNVILDETRVRAEEDDEDGPVYNIQGVTFVQRRGFPTQEPIPDMDGVATEIPVGVKVEQNTPITRSLVDGDFTSVAVTIRLPALVHATDKGFKKTSVSFRIEVQYDGGPWENPHGDIVIDGKNTSPYDVQYLMKLPKNPSGDSNPWNVKVTRITDDSTSEKLQNDTYFGSMTGIIDVTLQYPDSALMALLFDASEFDGSIPNVSAIVDGLWIDYPSNYNPVTRTYTGMWDGTFNNGYCNNAAWVYWAFAVNDRWGLGRLLDKNFVDKWALYEIGKVCDQDVPDGYGGQEPRFAINAYITKQKEAYDMMQTIASAFRGMSYWASGAMTATQDTLSDPKVLVTRASVINGDFIYAGSELNARHTVVHVKFYDKKDDYKPSIEVVRHEPSILRYGERIKEVDGFGLTSRAGAQRLGKWILYTEVFETQTVTYQAGLDHAMRRPGDIVNIMDPEIAAVDHAGRLVKMVSPTKFQLDRSVTINSGPEYRLYCTMPDGSIEDRLVINDPETTDTIQINTHFNDDPLEASVYILSSSTTEAKPWRIVSILERQKQTFEVTALEVYHNKYALIDDDFVLDDPDYRQDTRPAPPTNLSATEIFYYDNGVPKADMLIAWTQDIAMRSPLFRLVVDAPGANKDLVINKLQNYTYEIKNIPNGEFTIKVFAIGANSRYRSKPAVLVYDALGPLGGSLITIDEIHVAGEHVDEFFEKNVTLKWTNVVPEHNAAHPIVFQKNKIEVYDNTDPDAAVKIGTYYTKEPKFEYSYRMNRDDNGGTAVRDLKVTISAMDTHDRWGPELEYAFTNESPAEPTVIVSGAGNLILIDTKFPNDKDVTGQRIYISDLPDFVPDPSTLVYNGPSSFYSKKFKAGDYTVKVGVYDNFLQNNLNFTGPIAVTVPGLDDSDIEVGAFGRTHEISRTKSYSGGGDTDDSDFIVMNVNNESGTAVHIYWTWELIAKVAVSSTGVNSTTFLKAALWKQHVGKPKRYLKTVTVKAKHVVSPRQRFTDSQVHHNREVFIDPHPPKGTTVKYGIDVLYRGTGGGTKKANLKECKLSISRRTR